MRSCTLAEDWASARSTLPTRLSEAPMPNIVVSATNAAEAAAPNDAPAFEVWLKFLPSRTRFFAPSVGESEALGRVLSWAPTSALVWIAWDNPLMSGRSIEITLPYVGEPPIRPSVHFSANSIQAEVASILDEARASEEQAAIVRQRVIKSRHDQVDLDTKVILAAYLNARRRHIATVENDELKRQMDFFLDYDVATNPNFLSDAGDIELAEAVQGAHGVLRLRVVGRAVNPSAQPTDALERALLTRLSDIQLQVIRRHFPGAQAGIDVGRFDEAFIAFATSQLVPEIAVTDHWNGRPDSAFYFMFAEFAIHAIESHESEAEWAALLPTFMRCQDLYTEVFAPFCDVPPGSKTEIPEERRTFAMYRDQGNRRPANVDDVIQRMKDHYQELDPTDVHALIEHHANNAHRAFPLGSAGPVDPCDAVSSQNSTSNFRGGTMPADRDSSLKSILRRITHYMQAASVGKGEEFDTNNKWVVVNPTALATDSPVHFDSKPAEDQKAASADDDHVVGPLTVILDVSSGLGWNSTPFHELHVANKNLTIIGTRDGKPHWWSYPDNDYVTFVIVVPKRD